MSSNTGTVVPMCSHLLAQGLLTPFTLHPHHGFTCSFCAADEIEDALLSGTGPKEAIDAFHFASCDHHTIDRIPPHCRPCILALAGELTKREALATLTGEPTHSTRVSRARVRLLQRFKSTAPAPKAKPAPTTRKAILNGGNRQYTVRQPLEIGSLKTQGKPPAGIVVISPNRPVSLADFVGGDHGE